MNLTFRVVVKTDPVPGCMHESRAVEDVIALIKRAIPEWYLVSVEHEYVLGEPVAWRWRRKTGGNGRHWAYGDERPNGLGIGDCEVEPLYISSLPVAEHK